MQRRDQRLELLVIDVLQLVDEHRERRARLVRRGARRLEQRLEIVLEIAVVGETGLGVEIESDFDVLVLHLQRLRETGERAQCAVRELLRLRISGKPEQRLPQLRREDRWQRPVLRRLDAQRLDPAALRFIAHTIEQHGLPHAAQPDHQDALRRTPEPHALERDPDGLDQIVPAGEFGGRCPRPGRERIGYGIHCGEYTNIIEVI